MICKNCGKELPEDAKFCGFCGTPVEEIKLEEPVTEPVQPTEETSTLEETQALEIDSIQPSNQQEEPAQEETQDVIDTPSQPTMETEEPVQPIEEVETTPIETVEKPVEEEAPVETVEQPVQEEAPVEEKKDIVEEVKDSIKNTSSAKVILGDDGKLDKNDFARVGNQAKDAAKKAYQSIDWNEFKTFLAIFKDPFGEHALGMLPSCVVAIMALITNSWFFGHFAMGIIVTAVLYIAYFILFYINKGEEKLSFRVLFGKASQYYTVPILLSFILCIMSLFSGALSAELLYSSRHSFPMIDIIIAILAVFTLITYIVSFIKAGKKMNVYLLILFITVVICLILYIWFSFVLIQLANVLSLM